MMLRVPSSRFALELTEWQVDRADFVTVAEHLDNAWAFVGLGNADVDSWLFLQRAEAQGRVHSAAKQEADAVAGWFACSCGAECEPDVWVRGLQRVWLLS